MGYNPARKLSATKQLFAVSLFDDVYRSVEKEYGEQWAAKHLAVATLYIDEKKVGQLQLQGTSEQMQALTGMLVMRLAHEFARLQLEEAKSKGKEITVDLKYVAKTILKNIEKKIDYLDSFDAL